MKKWGCKRGSKLLRKLFKILVCFLRFNPYINQIRTKINHRVVSNFASFSGEKIVHVFAILRSIFRFVITLDWRFVVHVIISCCFLNLGCFTLKLVWLVILDEATIALRYETFTGARSNQFLDFARHHKSAAFTLQGELLEQFVGAWHVNTRITHKLIIYPKPKWKLTVCQAFPRIREQSLRAFGHVLLWSSRRATSVVHRWDP